jgi:hypothetical protein
MKIRKSIDHFTGKEQNALLHIRNTITDTIQPELLFFLNSQAFAYEIYFPTHLATRCPPKKRNFV